MRLPNPIYDAVKPRMEHHAPWHLARFLGNESMRGPGTEFPDLRALNEAGSGEQFLRFHRDMIRQFKWIIANTPGTAYPYSPWVHFPDWLVQTFEQGKAGFLAAANQEIQNLIQGDSLDDLGNFIEATMLDTRPIGGVHNSAHALINGYEIRTFGGDVPGLVDARMDSFFTSHHNEHFWHLHGWIDEWLAAWQRGHGEAVDQSPLENPPMHGHGHAMNLDMLRKIARPFERLAFRPTWER